MTKKTVLFYYNQKSLLFSFVVALLLSACQNNEIKSYFLVKTMRDGKTIEVFPDSLIVFKQWHLFVPQYHDVNDSTSLPVIGRGGTLLSNRTTEKWFKVSFSEVRKGTDLQRHRTYYAQALRYGQTIPFGRTYDLSSVVEQPNTMGFSPQFPLSEQRASSTINNRRSANSDASCTLLYIGYDEQGEKIGIYYPCSPDSLIWKFRILPSGWHF